MTLVLANEKRVPSSIWFPLTNGTFAIFPARSWCSGGWARAFPSARGSQGWLRDYHSS